MGVFEHFPYTNFHELNLDWILRLLRKYGYEISKIPEYVQDAIDDLNIEQMIVNIINEQWGVINVKHPPEGITPAVGDGSANDTVAINQCFQLSCQTGKIVYFPIGTYLVNSLYINCPMSIIGADSGRTNLSLIGGSQTPLLTVDTPNFFMTGMHLLINNDNQPYNPKNMVITTQNSLITNCWIDGGSSALEVVNSQSLRLDTIYTRETIDKVFTFTGSGKINATALEITTLNELGDHQLLDLQSNDCTVQLESYLDITSTVSISGNHNQVDINCNTVPTISDTGDSNNIKCIRNVIQTKVPTLRVYASELLFTNSSNTSLNGTDISLNQTNPVNMEQDIITVSPSFNAYPVRLKGQPANSLIQTDKTIENDTLTNTSAIDVNGKRIYLVGGTQMIGTDDAVNLLPGIIQSRYPSANVTNLASVGACVGNYSGEITNLVINQINSITDTPDIIVLIFGSDDSIVSEYPEKIGYPEFDNYNDTFDTTTYCGGINHILYQIRSKWPACRIAGVSSFLWYDNAANYYKSITLISSMNRVFKKWAVPLLNLTNGGNFTIGSAEQVSLFLKDGTTEFTSEMYNEIVGPQLCDFLSNMEPNGTELDMFNAYNGGNANTPSGDGFFNTVYDSLLNNGSYPGSKRFSGVFETSYYGDPTTFRNGVGFSDGTSITALVMNPRSDRIYHSYGTDENRNNSMVIEQQNLLSTDISTVPVGDYVFIASSSYTNLPAYYSTNSEQVTMYVRSISGTSINTELRSYILYGLTSKIVWAGFQTSASNIQWEQYYTQHIITQGNLATLQPGVYNWDRTVNSSLTNIPYGCIQDNVGGSVLVSESGTLENGYRTYLAITNSGRTFSGYYDTETSILSWKEIPAISQINVTTTVSQLRPGIYNFSGTQAPSITWLPEAVKTASIGGTVTVMNSGDTLAGYYTLTVVTNNGQLYFGYSIGTGSITWLQATGTPIS